MGGLQTLLPRIRECQICAEHLPLGPRPVLQVHSDAPILIAGQAPGRRESTSRASPLPGPQRGASERVAGGRRGDLLDPRCIAILPMGFCFPGTGRSGDKPPRHECAPAWREEVLQHLVGVRLILVLGRYAQTYHLGGTARSVTENVPTWREYWPDKLPLPHPSPRNQGWFKKNAWFADDVLPILRERVPQLLR